MPETPDERAWTAPVIQGCSLAEYQKYVGWLPRPSPEQIENFVQFVSAAHSWYKHLPLLPPGAPFHFFVDPFSGHDRIVQRGGGVVLEERTEASRRFHYTWMTTKEYRRRFACLAYESGAGTGFLVQVDGVVREYAEVPIFGSAHGAYRIPLEVAQAGMVELTAAIHPFTSQAEGWGLAVDFQRDRDEDGVAGQWPSETGGERTLQQIEQLFARPDARGWSYERFDAELAALLLPERQRLQGSMTEAINRVLALIYDLQKQ